MYLEIKYYMYTNVTATYLPMVLLHACSRTSYMYLADIVEWCWCTYKVWTPFLKRCSKCFFDFYPRSFFQTFWLFLSNTEWYIFIFIDLSDIIQCNIWINFLELRYFFLTLQILIITFCIINQTFVTNNEKQKQQKQ